MSMVSSGNRDKCEKQGLVVEGDQWLERHVSPFNYRLESSKIDVMCLLEIQVQSWLVWLSGLSTQL